MASLKKFLTAKGFITLELERTQTDHLALEAKLNGVPGRFIVDTGASSTCVGMDRAGHFGMASEISEIRAAGAGAVDMETLVSHDNSLSIDSWNREGLQVVLFDLSHVNEALGSQDEIPVDGILGADILRLGLAVIDCKNDCLFLK